MGETKKKKGTHKNLSVGDGYGESGMEGGRGGGVTESGSLLNLLYLYLLPGLLTGAYLPTYLSIPN